MAVRAVAAVRVAASVARVAAAASCSSCPPGWVVAHRGGLLTATSTWPKTGTGCWDSNGNKAASTAIDVFVGCLGGVVLSHPAPLASVFRALLRVYLETRSEEGEGALGDKRILIMSDCQSAINEIERGWREGGQTRGGRSTSQS